MLNFLTTKAFSVLLLATPAVLAANALTAFKAEKTPSTAPLVRKVVPNDVLAHAIIQLFNEDQALIAEMETAKKDLGFLQMQKSYVKRIEAEGENPNFYDPAVYELWARAPDAPELVRRYAKFRKATDARIESIVADDGWPQRAAVGDEAAAEFFFLFGHADDDNAWRVRQLPTIQRVFREDHLNSRLYAHMCDRLANVAGKPQIYGSVMGPGTTPGTAKLYWPLIDTIADADKRRLKIGLPFIEDDLETFREGAGIGPYMTPMTKGKDWSIGDVYGTP